MGARSMAKSKPYSHFLCFLLCLYLATSHLPWVLAGRHLAGSSDPLATFVEIGPADGARPVPIHAKPIGAGVGGPSAEIVGGPVTAKPPSGPIAGHAPSRRRRLPHPPPQMPGTPPVDRESKYRNSKRKSRRIRKKRPLQPPSAPSPIGN